MCFALAKGNADLAMKMFWEKPMKDLWVMMHCYYQYNGTEVKEYGEEEDEGAIIRINDVRENQSLA